MSEIAFTREEKVALVAKLQRYFDDELNVDLGQFDGEFLLDFIGKEIGASFYNKGVDDARTVVASRLQVIDEELYAIEKAV
ncbi:DUF2164 domain-containing protein [Alteromonas sp. KUL106]|uniref:DUF2164 domain-containing protein n=1 Tax=Alteromonas sp. KUL106 TaxID=2480799 RepID=UPI0012E59CEC|nr:DUF2164 domain-containing protein [Alteromonas sp. KUL106]GFD70481.1 hypothetical protein KUL106_37440 [Alteromonas sp. KUL106]